jgi:hypothetical protein
MPFFLLLFLQKSENRTVEQDLPGGEVTVGRGRRWGNEGEYGEK